MTSPAVLATITVLRAARLSLLRAIGLVALSEQAIAQENRRAKRAARVGSPQALEGGAATPPVPLGQRWELL